MKFATQVACISVVLCTLAATAFGAPTVLIGWNGSEDVRNGGFETTGGPGNMPLYWAKEAGRPNNVIEQHLGGGWFWGAGPHTGNYFMANASNWGSNGGVIISDEIPVTPGSYNLALSFWAWIYDNGHLPSMAGGELIVDGQVVAAAVKSCADSASSKFGYRQLWATWSGQVTTSIRVRFTLFSDGGGGWGVVGVDDAELWAEACPGDCSTQHDVTDVNPHVVNATAGTPPTVTGDTLVTISGTNLTDVSTVYLWKSLTRFDVGQTAPNDTVINGTPGTPNPDGSIPVTFATTGQGTGVFDLVVMKDGCNPVVISSALEILDPNATQNLLGNPSFEVVNEIVVGATYSDAVGSAAMWSGDYLKDPAMVPDPEFIDWGNEYFGIWGTWSSSKGEPGTETTNTWQTVAVAIGSNVYFEGWLDCNAVSPSTSDATVNVWDGDIGGTLIGTASIDETTPGTEPPNTWVKIVITGPSNSGYVTVQFTTEMTATSDVTYTGVFADAFTLTASPICSDPLNPWIAYPATAKSNTDATVTITGGSNLDEVSAVSLVRLTNRASEADTVMPGTVLSQSPTKLVVYFPLETNDAPTGDYNIVLEKASCPPWHLRYSHVQPRYKGLTVPPRYQPNVPATFANGFSFEPLLLNGDFEAEGKHETRDVQIQVGWHSLGATNPVYNGSTHTPPDPDGKPPWGYNEETDNCGSVSEGSASSNARIVQEGIPVRPNYGLTLTGWIYGGSNGGPYFHQVLIHDGDANGNIIGQYQLPNAGGGGGTQTGWQAVSIVDAMPTQSTVTVEWGHTPNGSTTYGTVTTHVDQLLLVQEKATCSPIFADADNDGDVDQIDFAAFQECFTGDEGIMPTGTRYDCGCFDVAGATPNLITQADLTVFERCATGPGIPAAYDCADQP